MRSRWPAVHWPSVRGRARAGAGPLALVAVVVLIVTMLAAAVPPLMRSTADRAARDAIRRAGAAATVQVQATFADDYGPNGGRVREPRLAADVGDFSGRAENALDPALKATLRPPITTVTGVTLSVTDGSVQRHFQVDYVRDDHGGPAVTWVAGHAPRGTSTGNDEIPLNGPKWEVQVGLSEAEAAALKLRPGDHVPVEDDLRNKYNVLVSGVFRPADPNDPAWALLPWLLRPAADLDGLGSTRLGGLMTADSLPDGRLALLPDQIERTVSYAADPDRLTWASAQRLATTVAELKATSASSADGDSSLKWNTQLDAVLRQVGDQVDAALAQASVLLLAVLTGGVLVLLLAADLLVRRRAAALIAARHRGTGLPDLAAELLIESVAVTVPAAALGVALAYAVAGGAALLWTVPVVLGAVVAGPAFGTLTAARATRDRRAPANRAARRWAVRIARLRRAAVDVAVLAAAAGAVVALRQRGIAGGPDTVLPASAPTLGVIAGTLLVLRLMPAGLGLVLKQSLRSRRPLGTLGAARAVATATRVLPLLVLTTTTGLAAFAVTLDTTTSHGMADGAWHIVGADARLDLTPETAGSATRIAARIAAAPGVTQVVSAQVSDTVRVTAEGNALTPSLVIVDAAAFQRLLASAPLPDAPDLSRLTRGAGPIPALVRTADGSLRPGMTLRLGQEHTAAVELRAVGTAPELGTATDVIIVDAAAGLPFHPDTLWVTGPGAARAVAAAATGGHAVYRADVLRDRREAPLNAGLVALDRATAGILLALALLGLALGAATSAPDRWETLARLRTLGLRTRDTRRVAAAELLPPVLVAAVSGPLLALLVVLLAFGPLRLRTLTGQTADPAVVVPWWWFGVMAVALLGAVFAVVAAEQYARRRRRLGDVLRAGGS